VCLSIGALGVGNARADAPPAKAAGGAQAAPIAGGAEGPSDDQRRKADDLFRQANKLYADGRFAEAEPLFQSAWKLNPTYDIAANLGHTEAHLNKLPEAAGFFAFALKTWPVAGDPTPRDLAQKKFDSIRAQVGALPISVDAAGAEVFVDGRSVGKAPLPVEAFVTPGSHTVEARQGSDSVRKTVTVAKGGSTPVALVFRVASGPNTGVVVAGTVLALGGIAAGAVLTIMANGKGHDADAATAAMAPNGPVPHICQTHATECSQINDSLKSRDAFSNGAMVGYIAGGAIGGATLIYWLATKKSGKATAGFRAAPVVGAREAGLSLGGSF
jgi:hypothetical protein